jgi:rfaE bifunctional protein kinase chain/domain
MTGKNMAEKKELLKVLEKIKGTPILVIGDIMLDRYIFGAVERISPEAPVPVVHVTKTENRLGGAGNAVRNLCNLSADVTLCGFIGDDQESAEVLKLLEKYKVGHDGVLIDRKLPTTSKTRVISQRQQIVRIDREEVPDSSNPRDSALVNKLIKYISSVYEKNNAVIFSDYGKGTVTSSVINLFEEAGKNKKIGFGIRPLMVDPHPTNYFIYKGMSVAKPNRKEAEIATGIRIKDRQSASKAARVILEKWHSQMVLISLGEDGLMIAQENNSPDIFIDTVAQEVSDVSGAGDAVTAVFTAALATGATPLIAGHLANIAAGIVVSEVGTVPIDAKKLLAAIEKL